MQTRVADVNLEKQVIESLLVIILCLRKWRETLKPVAKGSIYQSCRKKVFLALIWKPFLASSIVLKKPKTPDKYMEAGWNCHILNFPLWTFFENYR